MHDQVQLYDKAVMDYFYQGWCTGNILEDAAGTRNLVTGPDGQAIDVQLLYTTPDRRYADYVTKKVIQEDIPQIPRIGVEISEPVRDPLRFINGNIRGLPTTSNLYPGGACGTSKAPVPYNITYTIHFWSHAEWLMRRWVSLVHFEFCNGVKQLSVDIGGVWGIKKFSLTYNSLSNLTNVEAGEERKLVRYDLLLTGSLWIFDTQYENQANPIGSYASRGVTPQVRAVSISKSTNCDTSVSPENDEELIEITEH